MAINIINKGKEGEREFVNKYQAFFPDTLKRNLLQTREGGADISGCTPFQIEIKTSPRYIHREQEYFLETSPTSLQTR